MDILHKLAAPETLNGILGDIELSFREAALPNKTDTDIALALTNIRLAHALEAQIAINRKLMLRLDELEDKTIKKPFSKK